MEWRRNKNQEPPGLFSLPEQTRSTEFDNHFSVIAAERIVQNAFRSWTRDAGLGNRRAQVVLGSPAERVSNRLSVREREIIGAQADVAIAATFANLNDAPDFQS